MDERIYQTDDDQWFYRARGHHDVGPFETRQLAQEALSKKVRGWRGHAKPLSVWPRTLQPSRLFRRSATRHP